MSILNPVLGFAEQSCLFLLILSRNGTGNATERAAHKEKNDRQPQPDERFKQRPVSV